MFSSSPPLLSVWSMTYRKWIDENICDEHWEVIVDGTFRIVGKGKWLKTSWCCTIQFHSLFVESCATQSLYYLHLGKICGPDDPRLSASAPGPTSALLASTKTMMPLLRTLSHVSKFSCNAMFLPHITLVRFCSPDLRPNSRTDDSSATPRCPLSSPGSRASHTSGDMPHRHSLKRRRQIISLVFRPTQVIYPPTPRMSVKYSSNGMGPPDQSCG